MGPSPGPVQASDPATHIVTAREVATSSQGITHMEANIYQVDGNFLSNGCVAYQDAAGTLSNTARSCGLWFAGKSPGVYNIRFSAYDKAGNIVHSHVVGAVTVVP